MGLYTLAPLHLASPTTSQAAEGGTEASGLVVVPCAFAGVRRCGCSLQGHGFLSGCQMPIQIAHGA
eukprot:9600579-Alexandrium_andersonii.AAC.1